MRWSRLLYLPQDSHQVLFSEAAMATLKGQCVGIEAIQMLVNITSLQTMYDDIFLHIIIAPLWDEINIVWSSAAICDGVP